MPVADARASLGSVLRAAATPRRWRDEALQLGWSVRGGRSHELPLSWPLDTAALSGTVLRWPRDYGWGPARTWVSDLGSAIGRHVRVEPADIPQRFDGIVVFEWGPPGAALPVAIDYGDLSDVDTACVAEVALYFKLQYRRGGYGLENVVAGGFVPAGSRLYRMLPYMRRVRERADFAFDVYGRFNLAYAPEIRGRAVGLLNDQDRVRFEGGLRKVGYGEALHEAARARVCLDLPGRGDFCHRLVEYLAVGACIVSREPQVELHVPLTDGENIAFARRDLSDLVDVCQRYVEDDPARAAMDRAARDYFDLYLHRDQLASYYLDKLAALR